jgi:hypothetical protein
MIKIIAAFDGLKYSESTRNYAIDLAKQTKSHLVGVFLDDSMYNSFKYQELLIKASTSQVELEELIKKDKLTRAASADDFEKNCQQEKVEFTLHHDHNLAILDLKHESIYADLLVINSKETLSNYPEKFPTRFIKDLLGDVQCPVLITPKKFEAVEKVILLFNGEPASVHAIKMFSYLFHHLREAETEVISVNSPVSTLHLPDNKLMKEFMKRHYPNAIYSVMSGIPEDEILHHLMRQSKNTIVVLGAYQRGTVSRWFKESMADLLMREIDFPIFIAHNK